MEPAAIQISLLDGDPDGIVYVEMQDWAGQIAIFPRERITALFNDEVFSSPGLYLLVGESPSGPHRDHVCVGETENIQKRIKTHLNAKDKTFWKRVIVLRSTSGSLNKAHIKSLEAKIVKEIIEAGSAKVANQNKTLAEPHLAFHDKINVSKFLQRYKLILKSLGFRFFSINSTMGFTRVVSEEPTILNYSNPIFEINSVGVSAFGRMLGDNFVVARDSTLRNIEKGNYEYLTRQLIKGRAIKLVDNNVYIFTRDVAFRSPSQAACVITGTTRSGWATWKIASTKVTMKQWQEEMSKIFSFEFQYPSIEGEFL